MLRALVAMALLAMPSPASAAPTGTPCTSPSECDSGFCVDRVCCDAACDGQCEACDHIGWPGACHPVHGTPRGTRPPCATAAEVCKSLACDGRDPTKCTVYSSPIVQCGFSSCEGSTGKPGAHCDGMGNCVTDAHDLCWPYRCGPDSACLTRCASSADCSAAGFYCDAVGACAPISGTCQGTAITTADGKTFECSPFACSAGGPRTDFLKSSCNQTCEGDYHCAPGYRCSNRTCVHPATLSDDGCAYSPRASHAALGLSFLGAIALLARRRRRL